MSKRYMDKHFMGEETNIANKYLKRYSVLIIRKMQNKTDEKISYIYLAKLQTLIVQRDYRSKSLL